MARDKSSRTADAPDPKVRLTRSGLAEAARLFAYLLRYRGRFAEAMAALTVSSLLGLTFPYLAARSPTPTAWGSRSWSATRCTS
jgi:hypothetical protein